MSVSAANAAVLARWTPVATTDPGGSDYFAGADTPPATEVLAGLGATTLARVELPPFGNGGSVWSGTATPETTEINLGQYTAFTLTPNPIDLLVENVKISNDRLALT